MVVNGKDQLRHGLIMANSGIRRAIETGLEMFATKFGSEVEAGTLEIDCGVLVFYECSFCENTPGQGF